MMSRITKNVTSGNIWNPLVIRRGNIAVILAILYASNISSIIEHVSAQRTKKYRGIRSSRKKSAYLKTASPDEKKNKFSLEHGSSHRKLYDEDWNWKNCKDYADDWLDGWDDDEAAIYALRCNNVPSFSPTKLTQKLANARNEDDEDGDDDDDGGKDKNNNKIRDDDDDEDDDEDDDDDGDDDFDVDECLELDEKDLEEDDDWVIRCKNEVFTKSPSFSPSLKPTTKPSLKPTSPPTMTPTVKPTITPSKSPTRVPTNKPTRFPTRVPTNKPTRLPTRVPTNKPTRFPTRVPTNKPTRLPTRVPTNKPTRFPTLHPTMIPITLSPSPKPSKKPVVLVTTTIKEDIETEPPTDSVKITKAPTQSPTDFPSPSPTDSPTLSPSKNPTSLPTRTKTDKPTVTETTTEPTTEPTLAPILSNNNLIPLGDNVVSQEVEAQPEVSTMILPEFFVQIQTAQEGELDRTEILDKTKRYLTFRYLRDDQMKESLTKIDLKIVSGFSTPREPNNRKLLRQQGRKLMLSTVTFEGEAHFKESTSLPSIESVREITELAFTDFEREGIQLLVSLYKSSDDPVLSSVETLYADFTDSTIIVPPPSANTAQQPLAPSAISIIPVIAGTLSALIFLIGAYCISKKIKKAKELKIEEGSKYNFDTSDETAFSPQLKKKGFTNGSISGDTRSPGEPLPHPSEFRYNGDTTSDIGSELHYEESSFGVDDSYSISSQSYAYSMSYPPSVLGGHGATSVSGSRTAIANIALGEYEEEPDEDESVAEISLDERRFNSIMQQGDEKGKKLDFSSVWKKAQTPTNSLVRKKEKKQADDGLSIFSEDADDNSSYMGSDLMMSEISGM